MDTTGSIAFAAEKPLGKLAKWLRILGFDTIYEQEVPSTDFKNEKNRGRIYLTRRKGMRCPFPPVECLTILSDHVQEQLKEVVTTLCLRSEDIRPFSRCIRCNNLIEEVERSLVAAKVPDYVFETRNVFRICSRCDRIYWRGSHSKRIDETIKRLF